MTSETSGTRLTGWPLSIRRLQYTAMAVFLVTIAIGIVNGLDLYEFDRNQILTHVHSGTIGWISLSIIAATTWLARGIDRRLALALIVVVPIYVASFYIANPTLRILGGTALLVLILWVVVWAWQVARANRTLPTLAVALGLTTFTWAIIGVLRQVQLAGGPSPFSASADVAGAHASAMVFSYLILAAMGLLEWRVCDPIGWRPWALAQVISLFAAGLVISLTLLFLPVDAQQGPAGIYILVELIAVAIFTVRVVRRAVRVDWTAATAERHFAASSLFVLVATAIFLYVIGRYVSDPSLASNPDPVVGILTASDHAAFIGVITNLVFGLGLTLSADRADRFAGADQVVFWAMNLGLVTFLVGLIASSPELKRVGAPVMGTAILIGIAVIADRLWRSDLRAAEA